jgi:uncharacterized membrane protein
MIVWNLVLAVHVLCMAVWVGGMAYALLVLRPSLAVLDPAARLALHGQTFKRFFRIVWHVMPLTLLTGWAMVFGVYGGFAHLDWTVNVMQLLGLIMAGVFVALFVGPWKRFRLAGGSEAAVAATASIRTLITVNLALGALTVVVALLRHFGGS